MVQLGVLTTSVTRGGRWLVDQKRYSGFVNHGDSYTAAVTCQAVFKALDLFDKQPSDLVLAVVGAYGIIGEAVSKILVPSFKHSVLIGRREHKLQELKEKLKRNSSIETTTKLKTKMADVVVTATSHPSALLNSGHLKKNAVVVDVSQPPNVSYGVCRDRLDVFRVDGGFVDLPSEYNFQIPGVSLGISSISNCDIHLRTRNSQSSNTTSKTPVIVHKTSNSSTNQRCAIWKHIPDAI